MSAVGQKIDGFGQPMCNSFQAKILNDQLCYEVDLHKFSDKNNLKSEINFGFNFLMDYNEDRQVIFEQNTSKAKLMGLAKSVASSDQNQHAFVYLNTIGKILKLNTLKRFNTK